MASTAPVPEELQDPSQQTEEGKREQSTIAFPYQDLDEGLEIAKAVHSLHGSSCQVEQVAAHIKQSPTSSAFRLKVSTAKTFGLVTASQGTITLTPLGSRICDPQQEKAARVDAFLTVPLYNAVYEKFKGMALPPTVGLEAALVSLGVAQKQKDRARQVLQRSAQEAGFFQFGTDRLVLPAIKANAATPAVIPSGPPADDKKNKKTKDDDDGEELHPFIQGLLKKLPPADSEWPNDKRAKWLQAAVNIFDLMYTESEDDSKRTITIGFQRDSAKQ
jgi:hypothetical protein